MILRILWFGGVFSLFFWIGGHPVGLPVAAPSFDAMAIVSAVTGVISRPFHELVRALNGGR